MEHPAAGGWEARARAPVSSTVRRSLTVVALAVLLLSIAWCDTPSSWSGMLVRALAIGGSVLVFGGVLLLASSRVAPEESEPRRAARVLLVLTGVWSVGLVVTSVWPGHFEGHWAIPFYLVGVVLSLVWAGVVFGMVARRHRALATHEVRGPRHAALLWLDGVTGFAVVTALLLPLDEVTARPRLLVSLVASTAPWLLAAYFVSRAVLRELPLQIEPAHTPPPLGRRLVIVLLRTLGGAAAALVCFAGPALFVPPTTALMLIALASLGGFHLALEAAVHELPRGGRTLWFGALAAVLAVAGVVAVTLRLPRRATFGVYHTRFDECATKGVDGSGRIGPWSIVRATDPRGGVFLSTWRSEPDSDGVSYAGFAFRPNDVGTPFGDRHVELTPLGGEWFEFEARGPD